MFITESQVFDIGRDHLVQPSTFQYFEGWKLHNLSGQPVLDHSEKMFSDVQMAPAVF